MATASTLARAISTGGAAITLVAALASCSSGSASGAAASSPMSSSTSSTSPSSGSKTSVIPLPGKSAYSSQLRVVVTESANGTSLTINRGADVIVTLHSTYWQFRQASAPKVLVQAAPEIQGDPPSGPGGPGSGKGTVRETYHASAVGTAVITASRTTCGEALRCTPAQSSYRITVIVR